MTAHFVCVDVTFRHFEKSFILNVSFFPFFFPFFFLQFGYVIDQTVLSVDWLEISCECI